MENIIQFEYDVDKGIITAKVKNDNITYTCKRPCSLRQLKDVTQDLTNTLSEVLGIDIEN